MYDQNHITLAFKDRNVENDFNTINSLKSRYQSILAAYTGIFLYLIFIILDSYIITEGFHTQVKVRIFTSILVFITSLFFLNYKKTRNYPEIAIIISLLFAQAGHFTMVLLVKLPSDYGYAVTTIVLIFMYTFQQARRGAKMFIRRIAGLDAVEEALGRGEGGDDHA